MKLNADGSALVYSTYLGGSKVDMASGIAVDTGGNAYVAGSTDSTDFPTTPGAFRAVPGGGFITKLDPAGSSLVYSTYLNAPIGAIAVDAQGNAYVTGTAGTDFQTTPGSLPAGPRRQLRRFRGEAQSPWFRAGLLHLPRRHE